MPTNPNPDVQEILAILDDGNISKDIATHRLTKYIEEQITEGIASSKRERVKLASSLLWQLGTDGESTIPNQPKSTLEELESQLHLKETRSRKFHRLIQAAAAVLVIMIGLTAARALLPREWFTTIIPNDLSYVYFKGSDADCNVLSVGEWEDPYADHWAQTVTSRERAEELLGAPIRLPEALLDVYIIKQYRLWLDQYSNKCFVGYENELTPRKGISVQQMVFSSAEGKGVKIPSDKEIRIIKIAGKEVYHGYQAKGSGHHFLAWIDGNVIFHVSIDESFTPADVDQIAFEILTSLTQKE